jgi:urease accessory protein UreF
VSRKFNSANASAALAKSVTLLGELHPLLQQLGSVEDLVPLTVAASALNLNKVEERESLAHFLATYRSEMLLAWELPIICQAYALGSCNHLRELVVLDQRIAGRAVPNDFAAASRRIGQGHLKKLRPLRGERMVQRYLAAVECGQAHGWHTLVYGLTLVMYSLPLRQGLQNYARQTIAGFIQAAARPLQLSGEDCRDLMETYCADFPAQLECILATGVHGRSLEGDR